MATIVENITNGTIETPSMKAIALCMDIPINRLYAMSKKPVAGQVWDPTVINWGAITDYLESKLDGKFDTIEDLFAAAAEKDAWLKENAVVRTATGSNLIDVDGNKMPKRKAVMFEMGSESESLLCFKHDAAVYKMVYQTAGYTVIREVNEDGSFAKEEIRVISNGTLNTKCVPPTQMADGIQKRFSGEYVDSTKAAETATVEPNGAVAE